MSFEQLCDWIVLIGAVTIAITNIIKFFKKPVVDYKDKQKEEIKQLVKENLEELLPSYFDQYDNTSCVKNSALKTECLQQIEEKVVEKISGSLEQITKLLEAQSDSIEILKQGTKDVLRQKIMNIYHQHKEQRAFPIHIKEALDELYKDYKKEGGNSYIDKYYNRMLKWEITSPDDDDEF